MDTASESTEIILLSLDWDSVTWSITLTASFWTGVGLLVIAFLGLVLKMWFHGSGFRAFEIDQAEIGIGNGRVSFRPNSTDRQVAYAIWVELSTRKIGLPIDLEHDVIAEIYDSWYNFFAVTRELVKTVPVTQVRRDSTRKIIKLSIEVLNEGLRPHLTRWQARFRIWYDRELKRYVESGGEAALDPQRIQAKFPQFDELKTDMERVNGRLIRYREKMQELVLGI
jgi:hypothetical protein